MSHDECIDCCDTGMVGGCPGCGKEREATATELAWAAEDRAREACQVYARSNAVCSLGTKGCPLYHGR